MPPVGSPIPSPKNEQPLLLWLVKVLDPMKRTRVKQVLQHARVLVNGTIVTRHDHPVGPQDALALMPEGTLPPPEWTASPDQPPGRVSKAPFPVLYSDLDLLVVDKPSGLLSVANGAFKNNTAFSKLFDWLNTQKAGRPFVVHRLDRETSGLMVFARTADARDALQHNWEEVRKTYLAICEGCPPSPEGEIETLVEEGKDLKVRVVRDPGPDARRSLTTYKVLSRHGNHSLLELGLLTGRKHQIRVHLAHIGCPVAGDGQYGATTDLCGRIALHSWRISFPHPVTGQLIEMESPLPDDLKRALA